MDNSKLFRASYPGMPTGRAGLPGGQAIRPGFMRGPVAPAGHGPNVGAPRVNSVAEPRLIRFQPLLTIMGKGATLPAVNFEIQPYSGWIDAVGITTLQFRVEIWKLAAAKLILESSLFPEEDPEQWVEIKSWVAAPDPLEIVTAASDSKQYVQATIDRVFSRYIRWRVMSTGENDWVICFRIMALAGASFTSWTEKPRMV